MARLCRKRLALAPLLILALGVYAARAQTPAEIHACFHDAARLCGAKSGDAPGFFESVRIKGCMLLHVNEVSPKCRAVFRAHGL